MDQACTSVAEDSLEITLAVSLRFTIKGKKRLKII